MALSSGSATSPAAGATPVPELSGGRHFPCLDAHRALAAVMIVLTHAAFATGTAGRATTWHDAGRYLARLDVGAPVFFVLSAFLLYRPFVRHVLDGAPVTTTPRFYRRRVLRIFPAYWVALVGVPIVAGFTVDGVRTWIANILFLPAVGVDEPYVITQAWTVGVELSFYALLPLYAAATARLVARAPATSRARLLLVGTAALLLAGQLFRLAVVVLEPSWAGRSQLWLPMHLDLFAVGMAAAVVSVEPSASRRHRALDALAAHPAACWTAAAVVFVLVAQMDPPDEPFGLNGAEYLPRQLGYAAVAALWLLPAAFGDQQRGRLRAGLRSRPLVWLGLVSYGIYLWHLAFIDRAKAWTVPGYDDLSGLATFQGDVWTVTAIALVGSIAVATLSYRVVELPFLRRKDVARPVGASPTRRARADG